MPCGQRCLGRCGEAGSQIVPRRTSTCLDTCTGMPVRSFRQPGTQYPKTGLGYMQLSVGNQLHSCTHHTAQACFAPETHVTPASAYSSVAVCGGRPPRRALSGTPPGKRDQGIISMALRVGPLAPPENGTTLGVECRWHSW